MKQVAQLTPMMRQYFELKSQCPHAILFFRMGDFFEVFDEDAKEIAPKLDLVLTSREGGERRIPFCGVPHHSAAGYWLRLLKLNYRVAIADQVEDAKQAKGLVKREIVRWMTPGSIDELEGLDNASPNYILATVEDPRSRRWTSAVADVSTGELRMGSADSIGELTDMLQRFRPKEVLVRRFQHQVFEQTISSYTSQNQLLLGELPEAPLRDIDSTRRLVRDVVGNLENWAKAIPLSTEVLACLFSYLSSHGVSLESFLTVKPLNETGRMALRDHVIRDLELFETQRQRKSSGSLYSRINRCMTPMGMRLLKRAMAQPYNHLDSIRGVQRSVSSLYDQGVSSLQSLRSLLDGCPDLERLATRLITQRAKPVELAKIRVALTQVTRCHSILSAVDPSPIGEELSHKMLLGEPVRLRLDEILQESPGDLGQGDGVFQEGRFVELDRYLEVSRNGQSAVDAYQQSLRDRTGIPSLKIKSHKTYGLLIEVTKTHLSKVPEDFIRRQTMVNVERFATAELKELEEDLVTARDKAVACEEALYQRLISELVERGHELRQVASSLGILDHLLALAWLAHEESLACPQIVPGGDIKLLGLRHPTVEFFVGRDEFVPNDVLLSQARRQMLITGPNMAGKSTVMRSVAICAILSQMGSFVPARAAELPLFDQVFTRVGASDDLTQGLSTFMVEMTETAEVLRYASRDSLVILDEVGRGTSTQDGLAIASAILEDICQRLGAWTMFATHFHELVGFARELERVQISQSEVVEAGQQLVFTHRLVAGASGHSYGIEVARRAGVPEKTLQRAREFLQSGFVDATDSDRISLSSTDKERPAENPVRRILEDLDITQTTPLEAINLLERLKNLNDIAK